MLFLQSLFLANAALSRPHADLCFTGVQISEFVFSCFTAGYLKGWEEKKQRNFYSYPTPRSAPSWSERVKLGKVRKYDFSPLDLRHQQFYSSLIHSLSCSIWISLKPENVCNGKAKAPSAACQSSPVTYVMSGAGNRVSDGHGKFHRHQHKQDTVV